MRVSSLGREDALEEGIATRFSILGLGKNLPAMQETWVRPLGWEDLPEEGMATHSSIRAWRILIDSGA